MNKNLMNAMERTERANAIAEVLEDSFLRIEFERDSIHDAELTQNLLYTLQDILNDLRKDIELLSIDEEVVDVIRAVKELKK